MLPKKLRLPSAVSNKVINPNNQDEHCLIWCLVIAKLKLQEEKTWTGKFSQFSDLSKHKDIIDSFNEYYPKCSHLSKEITDDLIASLEQIFDMHINIYTYIDSSKEEIERYKMSQLNNSSSNEVARLLFVPYSVCTKSKQIIMFQNSS
jgi:hypothetical protein